MASLLVDDRSGNDQEEYTVLNDHYHPLFISLIHSFHSSISFIHLSHRINWGSFKSKSWENGQEGEILQKNKENNVSGQNVTSEIHVSFKSYEVTHFYYTHDTHPSPYTQSRTFSMHIPNPQPTPSHPIPLIPSHSRMDW